MKRQIVLGLAFLCSITLLNSCDLTTDSKSGSSGKTCEILVVSDKSVFDGEAGQAIRDYFMQPQYGLNREEPLFTCPNIPVSSFQNTKMFQVFRNIILIDVNPENKNQVTVAKDENSYPQSIYRFFVQDNENFIRLFNMHKSKILQSFYENEHARINKAYKPLESKKIVEAIQKKFGFTLIFPNEYEIARQDDNFMWIRKEAKDFGMGMLIYTFPYTDTLMLSQEYIMRKRDSITKLYVAGPADGSYMKVEPLMPIETKRINFNNSFAIENRGLWRLEGDFMGGPFVDYLVIDSKNSRAILLDAYLYSPRKPQRDLLMQVESICYTLQL